MTPADIGAGLELCRASMWNQVEDDWRCFFDLEGGGCRLAELDGAAVGTVAYLRYGRAFSWIAMMLVDPRRRRAGIGSHLMEAALDALSGEPCVRLDATPAGEPLYRRFGFVPEYALARARVKVPAEGVRPSPARVRPAEARDLARIFVRDRQVFGADRSTLLESFFGRARDLAWVADDGAALRGYCFGRPGHLYRQLGPIVAEGMDAARDLVAHCLSRQGGNTVAVDVPRHAPEWVQWLESAGFDVERPFLRMCRGENRHPGLPGREFAIAGPEFG